MFSKLELQQLTMKSFNRQIHFMIDGWFYESFYIQLEITRCVYLSFSLLHLRKIIIDGWYDGHGRISIKQFILTKMLALESMNR